MAESESKAVLCIPVQANFSMQVCNTQPTEIRTTSREQHASNGQAERTVQSVRKLANTLRSFAEEMINGCTSFEALTDRKYNGKVALWGETVLFKDVTAFRNKGDPVYRKGVWIGKSAWSDSHICLTRSGGSPIDPAPS